MNGTHGGVGLRRRPPLSSSDMVSSLGWGVAWVLDRHRPAHVHQDQAVQDVDPARSGKGILLPGGGSGSIADGGTSNAFWKGRRLEPVGHGMEEEGLAGKPLELKSASLGRAK